MRPGRTCLVTGASSGIGLATAIELQRGGHTVYGVARRAERMEPLRAAGGRVLAVDVTDDDSRRRAVETVLDERGRIDVLVNNAGTAVPGAVEDVPVQRARDAFEVNLFAAAELAQLVLPPMRAQGAGTIVNVSSIGGELAMPMAAWYYASKHALEALSDSLRMEVRPHGIAVVVVQPGIVKSDFERETAATLRAVSGAGPYGAAAERIAAQSERLFDGSGEIKASDPEVVATVIRAVVEAERPKARYAVGYLAKPLLALNRLLPDRAFDALMSR